jgi:hypothetical protein
MNEFRDGRYIPKGFTPGVDAQGVNQTTESATVTATLVRGEPVPVYLGETVVSYAQPGQIMSVSADGGQTVFANVDDFLNTFEVVEG